MIPVIIVAHHSRLAMAKCLAEFVGSSCIVTDSEDRGAAYTHRLALEMAADIGERVVIMEDDAIPVTDFHSIAQHWFDRHPDDLISFYLGTGRPFRWMPHVDACLKDAAAHQHDYINLPVLIHGVCYSIPANNVRRVLARMRGNQADYAIGAAWGSPIVYPVESLVEHRDGPPVERHPDGEPRVEKRVARALAGPLMFDR